LRLSFQRDAEGLSVAGLNLTTLVDQPSFVWAVVAHGSEQVRLEWVLDSTFRFFPVQADEEFGYVLHLLDLATNKVLALAGRFEAREFIDAIYSERQGIGLGLLAWAAAGEDPGPTPTLILENCRRFPGWNQANLPTCSVRQNWIMEAPGKTGLAFSIVHRRLWIPFQQPKSAASTWTRPASSSIPAPTREAFATLARWAARGQGWQIIPARWTQRRRTLHAGRSWNSIDTCWKACEATATYRLNTTIRTSNIAGNIARQVRQSLI
jgi:hypothetical protein